MPLLAGLLCKQMALAGRLSEGRRLHLVTQGGGVIDIADSGEKQFYLPFSQTHISQHNTQVWL